MKKLNKHKFAIASLLAMLLAIPFIPTKANAANEIVSPSCSFTRVADALGTQSTLRLGNGYWPSTTKQPIDPLKKDMKYIIDWGDGSAKENYPTAGYVKSYDPATQTPAEGTLQHKYGAVGKYTAKMMVQSIDGRTTPWINCLPGGEIYNKPESKVTITPNPAADGSSVTVKWESKYADRGCVVGTTDDAAATGLGVKSGNTFNVTKGGSTMLYLPEALSGEKTINNVKNNTLILAFCKSKYDVSPGNGVSIKTFPAVPPTITWTPPSANIDYGGRLNFGYTTTGATTCTVKNVKEGSNVVNNYIDVSSNPLQQNWSANYYADFTRRVECQNASGLSAVSDLIVTVKQPPVLGVSNTDAGGNVIPGNNIMSLAFGNYTIGQPGIRKTIAVINKGGGNLTGNLSIPNSSFTCVSGCNFNLPTTGVQKVVLEFKTAATGSQTTNATVGSNASNLSIQLFGNAIERFSTDASLDFGDVAIGKSKFLNLTIKDNSPVAPGVTPIKITPSSSFFACEKSCNVQVPIGGELKVRIKFTPKAEKKYVETLSFNSLVIPTTGTGVKPVFNVREQ